MRKAIIVGLTGQTGAGKSTVAAMLERFGYSIVDADKVARLVTGKGSPVMKLLTDAFGEDIVDEDGSLRRDLLAARAFSSPENTRKLNDITHPEICRLIMKKVEGRFFMGYEGVIVDAPQLFESGLASKCTLVLSVTAREDIRLRRIMERDGVSEAEARLRMQAQLPESFFREHSDIILENNGTPESLHEQVTQAARIIEDVISGAFPQ
ncbi:MAG: dephospho-CoA kinase [Clostridia bacterium]|nr:dephospho-CoA kinase [Clostridia bacterium]